MRNPPGNSASQHACPSHVTLSRDVSRVGKKLGLCTGTVGGVVSGEFAFPVRRRFIIAHIIFGPMLSIYDAHGFIKPFPSLAWCARSPTWFGTIEGEAGEAVTTALSSGEVDGPSILAVVCSKTLH